MRKKTQPNGFITLKVELPPTGIVRTIVVPEHMTLEDLSFAIQAIIGWDNSHMWSFSDGKRDSPTYDLPRPKDVSAFSKILSIDASRTPIRRVFPRKGSKLFYIYDFGDNWRHTITRMADPAEPKIACVKSQGPDGIEDFGGQWRLGNFIKAMKSNPDDADYDEMREWAGLDTPARLEKYLEGESAERKTKKLRSALKYVEPVTATPADKKTPMTEEEKAHTLGMLFATIVDSKTWKILEDALRNGGSCEFLDPDKEIGAFFLTMFEGLKVKDGRSTVFCTNPSKLTVLPEWVEMYKTHGKEWKELHAQFDLLEDYASASTHLYGALTVDELHDVILHYDPECTLSPDECLHVLEARACNCPPMPFRTEDRLLVSENSFPLDKEDIDEEIHEFRTEQVKHERWYPQTRSDLLKWADDIYVPSTPESENVRRLLEPLGAIQEGGGNITLAAAHHLLSLLVLPEDCCDTLIASELIDELDKKQKQELISALDAWSNTINISAINGNTVQNTIQQVKAPPKVGRNDACPCGSGKKFKQCCGRHR